MQATNDSTGRHLGSSRPWRVLIGGLLVLCVLLCNSFVWAKYGFSLPQAGTQERLDEATLNTDKPLVVHVFSPDCPHCQRQMPYFAGFYKKADLEAVSIVAVAVDCSERDALSYIEKKGLEFPVLVAKGGSLGDDYYKKGWPTTFVFAPGGKYIGFCDTSGPSYINEMLALIEKAAQ